VKTTYTYILRDSKGSFEGYNICDRIQTRRKRAQVLGEKEYGGPSSMGVPTKNLHTESDRQNR